MTPYDADHPPAALRAAEAAEALRYWLAVFDAAPRHTDRSADAGRHVDEATRALAQAREEMEREANNGRP